MAGLIRNLLPLIPRPLVRRVASRYVAGETLTAALEKVRELNAEGACASLDILGESVTERPAAKAALWQYLGLIEALDGSPYDTTVSIKLSMLGMTIDPDFCKSQVTQLFEAACRASLAVAIDMEDHQTTDATLRLYRDMQDRFGGAGCVLQAHLIRTPQDIASLPPRADVRLCKGIYVEPASVAYKDPDEIRRQYRSCLSQLLDHGHFVGIATHDEALLQFAEAEVARRGLQTGRAPGHPQPASLPEGSYEFQMLLGVKPETRKRLLAASHRVRVYVPYGSDWYAYSMRRLQENPAIAMHVIRALGGQ